MTGKISKLLASKQFKFTLIADRDTEIKSSSEIQQAIKQRDKRLLYKEY